MYRCTASGSKLFSIPGETTLLIVDAHLDIAWNAVSAGRGFLTPTAPGYLVSRSSLIASGVGLVFATLYTAPAPAGRAMRTRFVYENAHEAHIMATAEANYYRSCGLQLIGDKAELKAYVASWRKGRLAAVLLMEGADPVEDPSQLGAWTGLGVRIIGPAWGGTRYSGGTGAPGGLTELGVQLLKAMARKRAMKPMRDEEIPVFVALGRKVAEEGSGTERQKQNAKLWADAAKVTLGDPLWHNPNASVKKLELDS